MTSLLLLFSAFTWCCGLQVGGDVIYVITGDYGQPISAPVHDAKRSSQATVNALSEASVKTFAIVYDPVLNTLQEALDGRKRLTIAELVARSQGKLDRELDSFGHQQLQPVDAATPAAVSHRVLSSADLFPSIASYLDVRLPASFGKR